MAPAGARDLFLRSTFGRSRLVRLLGEWAPIEAASGMDFAERLALWLDPFDGIQLQAARQAVRAVASAPPRAAGARPPRPAEIAQDVQRVRGTLAQAIAQDPLALAAVPLPPRGAAAGGGSGAPPGDAGYAPFRQRHLELQRQMEMLIAPLREHVRQALARGSPALRGLAVLDAALEPVLARREQALLPLVPALLKRRFEQLRRAHEAAGGDGGWLDAFAGDWRRALLAELDLRLEPVAGLAEALTNDLNTQ